jgi:hypothetical protein
MLIVAHRVVHVRRKIDPVSGVKNVSSDGAIPEVYSERNIIGRICTLERGHPGQLTATL